MKDPFPLPPSPWLSELVRPMSERLNLLTLPTHIHEVVFAAGLYFFLFYIGSPIISTVLAPQYYSKLSRKKKVNWDAHVVSFFQSVLINALALWVMFADKERMDMDLDGRMWGYTGAAGLVQAFATGYFVWDLIITSMNLSVFGIGTLAHAIAALTAYGLGFRPFVNYYGCIFILWELSTPFLNIHWFLDKVNMTGTQFQLYNGILLLFTFFFSRLIFGNYQSYHAFSDIWHTMGRHPTSPGNGQPGVMIFATESSTVPPWLGMSYLASNTVLNSLNCYWFFMMVKAVRKRFVPAQPGEKTKEDHQTITEVEIDASAVSSAVPASNKPRSRRA